MKIVPKYGQVMGRVADLARTKSGIEMPNMGPKGVTIFVLIDSVGPDVKDYKPGDVVLPHHINHIVLRGGQYHRVIFDQKEILCTMEDVPLDQFSVAGGEELTSAIGALA